MNDADARDDVMGGWLDWEKVWEATLEKVSCTRKKFWEEVWVGTDMGTEEDPEIRCRLVPGTSVVQTRIGRIFTRRHRSGSQRNC